MSNPLKSPAPVLPAMGLHSFHNDSPPFAGAGTYDHEYPVPDNYSLDGGAPRRTSPQSSLAHSWNPAASGSSPVPHSGAALGTATVSGAANAPAAGVSNGAGQGQYGYPVVPGGAPYTGTRHRPAQPRQASNTSASSALPNGDEGHGGQTRETTAEDARHSEARSRRLMTGYHFGHPRSKSAERESSSNKDTDSVHGSDSPPLTEADVGPETDIDEEGTAPSQDQAGSRSAIRLVPEDGAESDAEDKDDDVAGQLKGVNLGDRRGSTATAVHMNRRRSSRVRDRETGYDRLNGMGDGEADLDETAPQGPGGTEEYLNGQKAYSFPRHRLRTTMKDESKIPVVIVACGSFSPPTYLHLRMFEMAKDEIVESQTYEIMAGYYSPVSSYYKKAGLAPAMDRVRMCELAVEHTSTWLMVDPWEAGQPEYQRTAVVLDHFDEMLNGADGRGGLVMSDGKRRKYKVMLLAGGDLIESFGEPGVWAEPDLHIILGRFGCLIVERAGSDVWAFLLSHDILYHHRRNVIVIKQLIYNDISSTKVRLFVRRGMSIKYLLPNSVIQYIYDNKLYKGQDAKAIGRA